MKLRDVNLFRIQAFQKLVAKNIIPSTVRVFLTVGDMKPLRRKFMEKKYNYQVKKACPNHNKNILGNPDLHWLDNNSG